MIKIINIIFIAFIFIKSDDSMKSVSSPVVQIDFCLVVFVVVLKIISCCAPKWRAYPRCIFMATFLWLNVSSLCPAEMKSYSSHTQTIRMVCFYLINVKIECVFAACVRSRFKTIILFLSWNVEVAPKRIKQINKCKPSNKISRNMSWFVWSKHAWWKLNRLM